MLEVQKYLLTHSLNELTRDHGVYARFSTLNVQKFSLNYDQIEAKDADPIAQECRGLILETVAPVTMVQPVGETKILALPMKRFFNYGQGSAAPVDFLDKETKLFDKVDGTLCLVYYDRTLKQWCVATRSVPDADLPMDGFGDQTFSSLFWKVATSVTGKSKEYICAALSNAWTYSFELCSMENQIVVKYDPAKVFLLAVKDNQAGVEIPPEFALSVLASRNVVFPCPESYVLSSVEDMLNFVSGRDPTAFEGLVVCDKDFNRVKMKNAGYLALNKIKDSVGKSPRSVLEIILLGKEDDVYPIVSETAKNLIVTLKEQLRVVLHTLDEEYARIYSEDRKTFALAVQAGSGYIGPHMQRWMGKCSSAHDWIMKSRKDGTWSDGFLDTLLIMCRKK